MPRLRLILGPAGSGKSWRVVDEIAQLAAAQPLPADQQPPLLLLVPEQQAMASERAVLQRVHELSARPATARVAVASFNRLAALLHERSGTTWRGLSDAGRRMLVWRLLEDEHDAARRGAQAAVLADLLAELALYGAHPAQLAARATELQAQAALLVGGEADAARAAQALAGKCVQFSALLSAYRAEHAHRGLDFAPLAASIPELLATGAWAQLSYTQVWIDGFASFTPAELRALKALLSGSRCVTATLLLDPQRRNGPAAADRYDWYAPVRTTLHSWEALARQAGAEVEYIELQELRRWPTGSLLARSATPDGPAAADGAAPEQVHATPVVPAPAEQPQVRALNCSSERAEVDAAARTILDLVAGGMRFGAISVATRSLEPYADLVAARFAEHGIPHFIDRRRPLRHHPAVELLRCGLRLALRLAVEEDVYTLLKTDLLPGPDTVPAEHKDIDYKVPLQRGCVDELESYAREHGLKPGHWLADEPWRWVRRLLRREDSELARAELERRQQETARLDQLRRELLAPLKQLARELAAQPGLSLRQALAALWTRLIQPHVSAQLEQWAVEAEKQPQAAIAQQAELHRGVLPALAGLLDEMVLLGGDLVLGIAGEGGLGRAQLCAWFEYGLSQLDCGLPPARQDCVLVTEIERGRHHPVRATLLLGLAEDSWPGTHGEQPLLSDYERELLNGAADPEALPLCSAGASEDAQREPYLALVAATRASEFLQFSRPLADAPGRARQSSPYFSVLCEALAVGEPEHVPGLLEDAALAGCASDLALLAALQPAQAQVQVSELLHSLPAAEPYLDALAWGRKRAQEGSRLAPLPGALMAQLLPPAAGRPLLRASASRLESFAACPFQHFARYWLRLEERSEPAFDALTLGAFYHQALQQTIEQLNALGYDYLSGAPELPRRVIGAVLAELEPQLAQECGRERVPLVLERARRLLSWFAGQLPQLLSANETQAQRQPWRSEVSFGRESLLPPFVLETAHGRLELAGYIDRLDLSASGAATVVDYKLGRRKLEPDLLAAGVQLQLLAYLLAVDGQPPPGAAGTETYSQLAAAAAEYQPLELHFEKGAASIRPQRVPSAKAPRGQPPLDQAGELAAKLTLARQVLSQLTDGIIGGEVAPYPARVDKPNGYIACSLCDYRALCRFDPLAGDRYRRVSGLAAAVCAEPLADSIDGAVQ